MKKVIYLDAAATALKPSAVIKKESDFLRNSYANAGRGICPRATAVDYEIESVREKVADFIGADSATQISFTAGTTDGLNRAARLIFALLGFQKRKPVVAVSDIDHHSARMPFTAFGADVVLCPLDEQFNYDINNIPVADIFVITAMSNVIGVPVNVEKIIRIAQEKNPNVITVVDAAQYVVHEKINAKNWNADFICFSGHKIGADTGVGIMYIKEPDKFYPDKLGGGMIKTITGPDSWTFNAPPYKFEAGTLPLTQIIGMSAAIDDLMLHRPNLDLIKYMYDNLSNLPHIKIITQRDSTLVTFYVDNMHVIDFGALVGAHGICLRVGNMCAGWLHKAMGLEGSARISVGAWNTMEDIKYALDVIEKVVK